MELPADPLEPIICVKTLAQRLQTLRLKVGWRLEDVADRAGVSRSTLYHLERGTTTHPRSATVHRLAEAYGVSIETLISPLEAPPEPLRRGRVAPSRAGRERATFDSATQHPGDSLSAACRFDRATNPAVEEVVAADPQLFAGWSTSDWEALYSTFGTGGALTDLGVRIVAGQINRDRETLHRLQVVLNTHLAEIAVGLVDTLFRQVCPGEGVPPVE